MYRKTEFKMLQFWSIQATKFLDTGDMFLRQATEAEFASMGEV
jgi:hypothetical protein